MDYFGGQGQPNPMGGMQQQQYYGQQGPMTAPRRTNLLTPEQINVLRSNVSSFSLALTQEEMYRSACNHYSENGELMLKEVPGEPNVYECQICHYRLMPKEGLSQEDVQDAVNGIEDILQTVKLMYVDAPQQALSDYMAVIALLRKLPQLYRIAADNQAKYDGIGNNNYNGNLNAFTVLNSILTGAISPQPMMYNNNYYGINPANAYQMPMQSAPTQAQSAMLNPTPMGGQQQQYYNPQPMVQPYSPNTTGYSYTPGSATTTESELERLRRENEELKAKNAAQSGDSVTVTKKMES